MSECEGPAISVANVVKTFEGGRLRILDSLSLEVQWGEWVALTGRSGCGKSTLLHLMAALDSPDSGELRVAGHDLRKLDHPDEFRRTRVGLVFQLHHLLPNLTAAQNVEIAMFGNPLSLRARRARAHELIGAVGLMGRDNWRPPALSGGERQRLAIARALANQPPVLLADEPTGSLDVEAARVVLTLFRKLQQEEGVTIVMVTHDPEVAGWANRVATIRDGKIAEDAPGGEGVTSTARAAPA